MAAKRKDAASCVFLENPEFLFLTCSCGCSRRSCRLRPETHGRGGLALDARRQPMRQVGAELRVDTDEAKPGVPILGRIHDQRAAAQFDLAVGKLAAEPDGVMQFEREERLHPNAAFADVGGAGAILGSAAAP